MFFYLYCYLGKLFTASGISVLFYLLIIMTFYYIISNYYYKNNIISLLLVIFFFFHLLLYVYYLLLFVGDTNKTTSFSSHGLAAILRKYPRRSIQRIVTMATKTER